ncbi:LA_2272 family surface repeat-containing protein [Bacteroidota bacterium]
MKKIISFLMLTLLLTFSINSNLSAQTSPVQISILAPIQLFNEDTSIEGLRLSLLYGKNYNMTGFDLGLVSHTTGEFKGVQFGFLGISDSDFTGWQDNSINWTKGKFKGLQFGIVNYAKSMSGVQFGLVNYTMYMDKGLQIGLINIIKENGAFPFFPIVNWSF